MWQPQGPGTACRSVSHWRHLCPRSGARSRHILITGSYPDSFHCTWQIAFVCATNSIFLFDVVWCPCSHFDITPPKSVLWWMNKWMNELIVLDSLKVRCCSVTEGIWYCSLHIQCIVLFIALDGSTSSWDRLLLTSISSYILPPIKSFSIWTIFILVEFYQAFCFQNC